MRAFTGGAFGLGLIPRPEAREEDPEPRYCDFCGVTGANEYQFRRTTGIVYSHWLCIECAERSGKRAL